MMYGQTAIRQASLAIAIQVIEQAVNGIKGLDSPVGDVLVGWQAIALLGDARGRAP